MDKTLGKKSQNFIDKDASLIAVMGPTGCGKTTFINEASGSNLVVGMNLSSQTSEIATSLPFTLKPPGQDKGFRVILIDTPGFDDTTKSDLDILRLVANYLETAYQNEKKLAGVIYMQRISDPRMGGTATRNVRMFRKLCGHKSMENTIIATTFWGKVSTDEGGFREIDLQQDKFFGRALSNGAEMMRQDSGKVSALEIISRILTKTPEALRIQKQMVDKRRALTKTDASQELYRALKEQLRMFQEEMDDLEQELQGARATGDTEAVAEIQGEVQGVAVKIDKKRKDQSQLGVARRRFWAFFG